MSIENIMEIIGIIYIAATAIAAVTPSNKDNSLLQKIGKLFDRIGFNIKGK